MFREKWLKLLLDVCMTQAPCWWTDPDIYLYMTERWSDIERQTNIERQKETEREQKRQKDRERDRKRAKENYIETIREK